MRLLGRQVHARAKARAEEGCRVEKHGTIRACEKRRGRARRCDKRNGSEEARGSVQSTVVRAAERQGQGPAQPPPAVVIQR
eukprot:6214025-Pleurochrysis_carterae.AAC.1